jgi:hypothetical protein
MDTTATTTVTNKSLSMTRFEDKPDNRQHHHNQLPQLLTVFYSFTSQIKRNHTKDTKQARPSLIPFFPYLSLI